MSGDHGDRAEGEPSTWLSVTPLQYRRLELWKDGEFHTGAAAPPSRVGAAVGSADRPTPSELDRAAVENCVGGGFFPGIEVSKRLAHGPVYTASDPYRLDHDRA